MHPWSSQQSVIRCFHVDDKERDDVLDFPELGFQLNHSQGFLLILIEPLYNEVARLELGEPYSQLLKSFFGE